MTDEILVFAYGTLQSQFTLHHQVKKRCNSKIETVAKNVLVGGYKLAVKHNYAFPIAFPAENAYIRGSILSVNSKTLREMIDIEYDYFIKVVFIEHEGEWFRCLMFWTNLGNEKPLKHRSFLAYARQHNLSSLYKKR
jgi:gamma-glutamylcyclotransferase (GGCT)/AIG2-like uncharacterized protein YtfP